MLLPDLAVITGLMARYRAHEHRFLAAPHDGEARMRFEDTAYTLCVLMGERTAREAVVAAERYVARGRRKHGPAEEGAAPREARTSLAGHTAGFRLACSSAGRTKGCLIFLVQ